MRIILKIHCCVRVSECKGISFDGIRPAALSSKSMIICISRHGSSFDKGICLLTLGGQHRNCLRTTSPVRSSVARLVDIAARVACSPGALPGDPQGLADCGAQQSYDWSVSVPRNR